MNTVKHEWEILVNKTGNPTGGGTCCRVQAQTEFEAIQIALGRVSGTGNKVARIKLIR